MKLPSMPRWNAIVEESGKISQYWDSSWFSPLQRHVEQAPYVLAHVKVTNNELVGVLGSFPATPFVPTSQITTAFYRMSYALHTTRAGSVSGAVQLILTWTSAGVAQTESFANMNGNTTTTRQDDVFCFRADANTAISYELVYSSAGATTMLYNADITLELMPDPMRGEQ